MYLGINVVVEHEEFVMLTCTFNCHVYPVLTMFVLLLQGSMGSPGMMGIGGQKGEQVSNHVIGVCLLSQSASEKHSKEKKTHKPLRIS